MDLGEAVDVPCTNCKTLKRKSLKAWDNTQADYQIKRNLYTEKNWLEPEETTEKAEFPVTRPQKVYKLSDLVPPSFYMTEGNFVQRKNYEQFTENVPSTYQSFLVRKLNLKPKNNFSILKVATPKSSSPVTTNIMNTKSFSPSQESINRFQSDLGLQYNNNHNSMGNNYYFDDPDYSYDVVNDLTVDSDAWSGQSDWVQHWIDR